MYMREMGTVELLTRQGEILLAKRIEDGLKHVLTTIAQVPAVIESLLAEHEKIESGEKRLNDLITGFLDLPFQQQAAIPTVITEKAVKETTEKLIDYISDQ